MPKLPSRWLRVLELLRAGPLKAREVALRLGQGYGVTCLLLVKMKTAGLVHDVEIGGGEDSEARTLWSSTPEGSKRRDAERPPTTQKGRHRR